MSMNNPQEECPDTDKCAYCDTDISEINTYLALPPPTKDTVPTYWQDGFCTQRCAYAFIGRERKWEEKTFGKGYITRGNISQEHDS